MHSERSTIVSDTLRTSKGSESVKVLELAVSSEEERGKNIATMQGMSFSSLKKHYYLIPLFVSVGLGVAAAVLYPLRLALRSPDVSWAKKSDDDPADIYKDKQYKFYSPTLDYNKVKSPAPEY